MEVITQVVKAELVTDWHYIASRPSPTEEMISSAWALVANANAAKKVLLNIVYILEFIRIIVFG